MDKEKSQKILENLARIGEFVCSCPGDRHAVVLSRLSEEQLKEKLMRLDKAQAEQSLFAEETYQKLRADYVAEIAKYS